MCTSFMFRGKDTLIAMNYDNKSKDLKLEPHRDGLFVVTMHSYGKDRPIFGVRNDGIMANQQIVNECDGGEFRRGPHIIETSSFVGNILTEREVMRDMESYLKNNTVVNPPQMSIHTMIAYPNDKSYIVEPGRGIVDYSKDQKFIVMSNCSIIDFNKTGKWEGYGIDRQLKVEEELKKATDDFSVKDAFLVLDKVKQVDGEWPTAFSFVYSYNENKVYYCYDHKYDEILEYKMN